ncbi:MAG: hypothetical protein WBA18_15815 [Terracidiphilus sp.]
MSNAVQVEQNQAVTAGNSQSSSSESWTDHKFVPGAERPTDEELYGFRSAMAETVQAQDDLPRAANKTNSRVIILLVLVVSALAALLVYGVMAWLKPKPQALYNDLGTERYDPAGLGGRMIAQWTGGANYKFTVDPLDPALIPAFQATLANPPHAITYSIKLKDATNDVVCQKDIVVPGVPEGQGAFDASTALEPRTIPTGDTLQNVAGANGQIGEMVLTGTLSCDLDAFNKIVAWEFATDFPPLSSQQDWKKHEDVVREDADKAKHPVMAVPVNYGGYYPVKSLPAPIEADDVIVSDNPGKGVVATSSGRAFLVGTKVLVNPALDWQIFPAEIHYRCDRTAMCMVTRLSSRSAIRAHLMK